jgi:hypothetical protein
MPYVSNFPSLIYADNEAKKREELSERIATKLKSETSLHNEILEKERELKGLKISTDSADFVIKHKEVTVSDCPVRDRQES